LLRSAVSDYIDRIVDGCGLRQRVITQPRPIRDIRQRLTTASQKLQERFWMANGTQMSLLIPDRGSKVEAKIGKLEINSL
jgi:hypothetical protein